METPSIQFNCQLPTQVAFGWGRRREVGQIAASLGGKPSIVVSSQTIVQNGPLDELIWHLQEAGVSPLVVLSTTAGEPTVDSIDELLAQTKEYPTADLLIAIGGGSVLDTGKSLAALARQSGPSSILDYLASPAKPLPKQKLQFMALPTTAGTGSEATINSVVTSYQPLFKKSLRSPRMIADVALIDPELTVSLPTEMTAWTGMDAITQCIESYVSARATPFSRMLALEGCVHGFQSILAAFRDGANRQAREGMAHCAFLSGAALANSGLGLAHGVAAALGAHCHVPHGLACAVMLPAALRFNRDVRLNELATIASAVGAESTLTSTERVS